MARKKAEKVTPEKEKPAEGTNTPTQESTKLPAPVLDMKPVIFDAGDFNQIVARAEAEIESIRKIKVLSLRVTNERDWVNHNGNPYLEVMGAMKVAQVWGISIKDMKQETKRMSDDDGEYYVVITEGKAEFKSREISEIGTCTSRDDFFGVKNKEWKALEDVSYENVAKASATNFHNRVIKKILGLAPTWEDMAEAGLKKDLIRSINNRQSGATPEDATKQTEVRNMLREMYLDAGHLAKLYELSAFVKKDGSKVDGVKAYEDLQGIRLAIFKDKVTKIYTGWKKDMAGNGNGTAKAPAEQPAQGTQTPPASAQKPASTPAGQPEGEGKPANGGVKEKPILDVMKAIAVNFGNIGHIRGFVGEVKEGQVGKEKKTDKTTFEVYVDGETNVFIEVFMWGKWADKCKNGDVVIFKDVIKSDYNGKAQYNAKSLECEIPF